MNKPLIMVVEDEQDMANHIIKTIEETGRYSTVAAKNGVEAFKLIDKNKNFLGLAENNIKCIILDLKMPEMNGVQFINKLRKNEGAFKLTPVIVLTAYEDVDKWTGTTNPNDGLAADYLKKPFKEQELIDDIDRIFRGESGYMIDSTRDQTYDKVVEAMKNDKEGD